MAILRENRSVTGEEVPEDGGKLENRRSNIFYFGEEEIFPHKIAAIV